MVRSFGPMFTQAFTSLDPMMLAENGSVAMRWWWFENSTL